MHSIVCASPELKALLLKYGVSFDQLIPPDGANEGTHMMATLIAIIYSASILQQLEHAIVQSGDEADKKIFENIALILTNNNSIIPIMHSGKYEWSTPEKVTKEMTSKVNDLLAQRQTLNPQWIANRLFLWARLSIGLYSK